MAVCAFRRNLRTGTGAETAPDYRRARLSANRLCFRNPSCTTARAGGGAEAAADHAHPSCLRKAQIRIAKSDALAAKKGTAHAAFAELGTAALCKAEVLSHTAKAHMLRISPPQVFVLNTQCYSTIHFEYCQAKKYLKRIFFLREL